MLDFFQTEAIARLNERGKGILGDPMGARKTGTTLAWLEQFPGAGEEPTKPDRALVLAPNVTICKHWASEAAKYAPSWDLLMSNVPKEQRHERIRDVAEFGGIYISTYGAMKMDVDLLMMADFDTFIADEAHAMKGRNTLVTLAGKKLAKQADYRVFCTGTPVRNRAEELFTMLHMLYPKTFPHWTPWVTHWFNTQLTTFNGKLQRPTLVVRGIKKPLEAEFAAMLAKVMIQRPLDYMFPGESWIEEPEHIEIPVTMTGEEKREYARLVKHGWIDLLTTKVSVDNQLALSMRCQQLASDWGTLDNTLESGSKVAAVCELLDEVHEPAVVFTRFVETARRVVQGTKKRARMFTGSETEAEKADALQAFRDGTCDVLVGTFGSLGEGVDGLQHTSSCGILLDHLWTPGDNDQAVGRLRRDGQKCRVTIYHFWNEGTVDKTIAAANLEKVNLIRKIKGQQMKNVLYGKV